MANIPKRGQMVGKNWKGSSMVNPKQMCLRPTNFIDNSTKAMLTGGRIKIIDQDTLEKLLQSHGGKAIRGDSLMLPMDSFEKIDDSKDDNQLDDFNLDEIDENIDMPNDTEEVGMEGQENDEEEEQNPHDGAVCCIDCKVERKRFERIVISKLNSVLELVRGITTHAIDDGNVHRGDYALLPLMPIEDVPVLEQFDRDLEDAEFRNQFKNKIKDIGGKTAQKAVKFAMEAIMTDALTKRVVWSQGADNMPKLSKFRFPSIVNDVVRNNFEETKRKEIDAKIADWLRRGGDRLKLAALAAAKKRQQQPR